MIFGFEQNYLFLHSRKTAGSSICVELAKHFGPDDIMVGCWVDAINHGVKPNAISLSAAKSALGYRRLLDPLALQLNRPERINGLIKSYYLKKHGFAAAAHTDAETVREFAGDFWDKAFKFAFVRNPWDQAVSDYYWQGGSTKAVSFKDFLKRLSNFDLPDPERIRPSIASNWSIYTIDDHIVADFIGRFETMDADLKRVSECIGINLNLGKTKAKTGIREKIPIEELYDEEAVELVRNIYRKEIEEFRYEVPF